MTIRTGDAYEPRRAARASTTSRARRAFTTRPISVGTRTCSTSHDLGKPMPVLLPRRGFRNAAASLNP